MKTKYRPEFLAWKKLMTTQIANATLAIESINAELRARKQLLQAYKRALRNAESKEVI